MTVLDYSITHSYIYETSILHLYRRLHIHSYAGTASHHRLRPLDLYVVRRVAGYVRDRFSASRQSIQRTRPSVTDGRPHSPCLPQLWIYLTGYIRNITQVALES